MTRSLLHAAVLTCLERRVGVGEAMATSNVDFVDAYLAEVARGRGESVCSFDRDFDRLNVEWVQPG